MSRVPVLEQDGTGLCYAYAAAQMIDAYRFSHGDKNYSQSTSPIAAAVLSAHDNYMLNSAETGHELSDRINGKSPQGGGQPFSFIDSVRSNGSCSESAVRSYVAPDQSGTILTKLLERFDDHQEYLKQTWFFNRWFQVAPDVQKINCYLSSLNTSKNLQISTAVIQQALKQSDPISYLSDIVSGICKNHTVPVNIPIPWRITGKEIMRRGVDPDEGFNKIFNDSLSAKNPQPIGIGFCAQAIYNDFFAGRRDSGNADRNCAGHAALVVGRRQSSDGKCEFLIRNSHGTSCEGFKEKTDVLMQKRECIDGTGEVWVPAQSLEQNVLEAYGLADQK